MPATEGSIEQLLTRQAARWAVAAQQDGDLFIALLHASYGVAYVLALEHLGVAPRVRRLVLDVAGEVEARFPLVAIPAMYELGTKLVRGDGEKLVPWLVYRAQRARSLFVPEDAVEAIDKIVLANVAMGFVMAVRQIASDGEVERVTGVNPRDLEAQLGTVQIDAMKQATAFLPEDMFPRGPLVEIAGHG